MMTLTEFFSVGRTKAWWESAPCFQWVVQQPSPLFFRTIFTVCQEVTGSQVFVASDDEVTLRSQLFSSFLGSTGFYMLRPDTDIPSLDLASYDGPHRLLFFSKQQLPLKERACTIAVEPIDLTLYTKMASWAFRTTAVEHDFVRALFAKQQTMSIDTALLLMHYQQMLGKNKEHFFSSWFSRLVEHKRSFFTLSQYFFARDPRRFYAEWLTLHDQYPAEFWVAFWSEQLWQAIIFVHHAQTQGPADAKKLVSRLPFSFMQKDWQRHTVARLVAAHDALYAVDYNNKHGSQLDGLQLWCATFVS